jgi:hypothetical protein
VTVQPLPNSASNAIGSNDVSSPSAVTLHGVPVHCGVVKIPIAAAGDGDAFAVTITAAGTQLGAARASAYRHATRAPAIPVANCVAYGTRSRAVAVTLRRARTPRRTRRTHRRASARR